MGRIQITKELVESFVCPEGQAHLEVFDSELHGLYLDVLKSGRKSYRVRCHANGKTSVVTLGHSEDLTPERARLLAAEVLGKIKLKKTHFGKADFAFGQTIEAFFRDNYLPYVKSYKRSWDTDESMIRNHLVPNLGHLYLSSLMPSDVAIFVEKMKKEQYAPGTINRALVLLRYGYVLAGRWGLVSAEFNPLKLFKNLVLDNKIEHFLTSEKANTLLFEVKKCNNEMLYWIVAFLLYTGARKREVLDAKWDQIDFDQRSWRIPKTKSGKVRHVPLSEHALQTLASVRKIYGPMHFEYIFANLKTGLPFVSIFVGWNAARKRAGLSTTRIHDLRHSFASFLVNAGRSLYEVQEILGHSDMRTTTRYAHLSRERLLEAVECIPSVS